MEAHDASVVYENYETAKSRVDFLYQSLLPSSTGGSNALTDINPVRVLMTIFPNVRRNMETTLFSMILRHLILFRLFPIIFM